MKVTFEATTAEQVSDLIVQFAREAWPSALKEIADALARGNQEQSAQLREMRQSVREELMATKEQVTQQLGTLGAKLDKISGETTGLVTQVRSLQQAVEDAKADGANIPVEIVQAIDALSGKADAIDGLVDDVAPNPTPTPEAPAGGTGTGTDTGDNGGDDDIGKVGGI